MALIAGPTASGKSALAVALAKSLSGTGGAGVVVNADASQVYADLRTLSARPADADMGGVPHRLFGHVDAAEAHNAARWAEEARGVVITLSGSVLFATGQSALLPIAKQKIDEVAKAVKDQGFKSLLVEGHTDSQGSATKNNELSQARAESVRQQLASNGIPSDKIRAQGLGSSRPVADNNTAEGRANNRRVEIVVEPLGK